MVKLHFFEKMHRDRDLSTRKQLIWTLCYVCACSVSIVCFLIKFDVVWWLMGHKLWQINKHLLFSRRSFVIGGNTSRSLLSASLSQHKQWHVRSSGNIYSLFDLKQNESSVRMGATYTLWPVSHLHPEERDEFSHTCTVTDFAEVL